MIFLTGAAGKTGQAILKALMKHNASVMPLVRSEAQVDEIRAIGDFDCLIGDLRKIDGIESQLDTVDVLYYICPNIAPDELEIGKNLIQLAKKKKIPRFVYHSVLHPQIESMPHHWQKMRMEEALFESGLSFTILQPCAYMQNILGGWNSIKAGKYITPYRTSSRISMVDLDDVAKAAAKVMTQPGFENAIFELAGPEALTQQEVARYLSLALGASVTAEEQSREDWQTVAQSNGMKASQAEVLLKMFNYYDEYGLVGNPGTLHQLLGRSPTSFSKFLERILISGEVH
jgi:NAD(P)H dehydrogenase (quinone)